MDDSDVLKKVRDFYDHMYKESGLDAQRRYPNEELCRFIEGCFSHYSHEQRKNIKILETGCGSGAHLWMLAKEGFDTYGIDLSQEALLLCQTMLDRYGVCAHLSCQNMADMSFFEAEFDVVLDVFSSYCLTKTQGEKYLKKVKEILRPGGFFFSYFPSKKSDAYQDRGQVHMIDADTLDSVSGRSAPFSPQLYPCRFLYPREYERALIGLGFDLYYSETVGKTYHQGKVFFEFIVIVGKKRI